ncbi:MAG: hypothetical protein, partial [Olavius algarvensis Gamma 1 endosymbiont]
SQAWAQSAPHGQCLGRHQSLGAWARGDRGEVQ